MVLGISTSLESLTIFLAFFFPPGAEGLLSFDSSSKESFCGSILQKVAPKFFMMEWERVGGSMEQPKQFLLEQGEPL